MSKSKNGQKKSRKKVDKQKLAISLITLATLTLKLATEVVEFIKAMTK